MIDGVSGRDISDNFGYPDQQEVIYLPGTVIHVNNVTTANDGNPLIFAKEMAQHGNDVERKSRKGQTQRLEDSTGEDDSGERNVERKGNDVDRVLPNVGGMQTNERTSRGQIYKAVKETPENVPDSKPEVAETVKETGATAANSNTVADSQTLSGNDNYRITKNQQYGSVEVRFNAKPSDAVRDVLKSHKFKWNKNKGVWYGYGDISAVDKALDVAYDKGSNDLPSAAFTESTDQNNLIDIKGDSYGTEQGKVGEGDGRLGEQQGDTEGQAPGSSQNIGGDLSTVSEVRRFGRRSEEVSDSEGRRIVNEDIISGLTGTAIVDNNCNPIAVYHFTDDNSFIAFSVGDIGFHFGTINQAHEGRNNKSIKAGRTIRTYLSTKRKKAIASRMTYYGGFNYIGYLLFEFIYLFFSCS